MFFDDLTPADRARATGLGYTEETWELPGEAAVEGISYESQSPGSRTIIDEFGWMDDVWDVRVLHSVAAQNNRFCRQILTAASSVPFLLGCV